MRRLLICLALLLAASGAQAQYEPTEEELASLYERASMFQVLSIERVPGQGYVYDFETSQSFADQDTETEPRVLYAGGGVLTVRSSGVEMALVFVESDGGYSGLMPNALLLTDENPVGRMETVSRNSGGPFLTGHSIRVLVCTDVQGSACGRWIEAMPQGGDPEGIFLSKELYIIMGPELGGGRMRPVDD